MQVFTGIALSIVFITPACSQRPAPAAIPMSAVTPLPPPAPAPPPDRWHDAVARLEAARSALAAARPGASRRAEARELLYTALTTELLPAWFGTPWSFYGHAVAPGTGSVACGHFVGALLYGAGLRVDREHLGDLHAEHIIQTVVPERAIRRSRGASAQEVVAELDPTRPGLYLVGLDDHVGLLWADGQQLRFCHSDWVEARGVRCEDPERSVAFRSRYRVTGDLLDADTLDGWVEGRTWVSRRGR